MVIFMPLAPLLNENKRNKRSRYTSLRGVRPESPYNFSDILCFYGWNTSGFWL